MASLPITIADDKVPRLLAAFGHWSSFDPLTRVWVPATAVEVRARIKEWALSRVEEYETQIAVETVKVTSAINHNDW